MNTTSKTIKLRMICFIKKIINNPHFEDMSIPLNFRNCGQSITSFMLSQDLLNSNFVTLD